MKEFFKKPQNIVLLSISGCVILSIILAQFWSVFIPITLLVLGVLCLYLAYYMFIKHRSQTSANLDEFFPNQTLEERKKNARVERDNKINLMIFVYSFAIIGVLMVYLFFKYI